MPSSVISHFSYNEQDKVLKITFVTGLVYHYKNVPKRTYSLLKSSISKGRYFNFHIKDKFKFEKIESD
ncbi:KTSC domain-containing protein [Pedobacter endophyticus]|uniref:KTSC domain-containing protein n=1 Tax=Pedobacter endophyticus TaxID=2789740 RepID=A0A7S9L1I2_9SPHI|nr:KTSC domain-containing protein [Pedobacter endophyticus]QPH40785.1 KTSC domain-containing protein [Pedobacter endophyticus]